MKELIDKYMERAEFALNAADSLLKADQLLALANRAYYAIFYCACALLLTEGVVTKKHEGTRVKFHELFVKTGRFDKGSRANFRAKYLKRDNLPIMIWTPSLPTTRLRFC